VKSGPINMSTCNWMNLISKTFSNWK
jgi:hypothetical protein